MSNFEDNTVNNNFDENFAPASAEQPLIETFEEVYSRYNNNYWCKIEKLEKLSNKITLTIEMRGDMSLGECQNPTSSRLYIGSKVYSCIDSNFCYSDSHNGYNGDLIYEISENDEGEVKFIYGIGGYSTATLITL